ncbi:MAG: DUF2520 domain-containing protein [Flavobacteriaceae bacterium]|nr:MAG: DUF2520 domain-containing protein [Flavobacteriaceae bacterium]
MISVAIVGHGNIGTHLYNVFSTANHVKVIHISPRDLSALKEIDITFIAVPDNVIGKISSQIKNSFVVHTSGSVNVSDLKNSGRKGVFYPLQTFTKGKAVDFSDVPICVEAENHQDLILLEKLAKIISNRIYHIHSEQRKYIHIAAVFVNNFVNHLYTIAHDICKEHEIPYDMLRPLIKETADKINKLSPAEAQTGPAKRNDIFTIQNHLNLLNRHQQEIYTKLTASIQNYGKKL